MVTGIGVVSPIGIGAETFWGNLLAGVSGIDRAPILMDSDCPWKIAAEVRDFHPEKWIPKKHVGHMDRFAHFGVVSSVLAQHDARIDLEKEDRQRIGVAMGTAYTGLHFVTQQHVTYLEKGLRAVSPFTASAIFSGSCGAMVSMHLGLKSPSVTVATGCESSTAAIAQASEMIISGDVDAMFAGGADATVHPLVVMAMGATRALSDRNNEPQKASRPYDLKRDGFVMGEGGAMLMLEELQRARRRGARIYAEIIGWANTCDAHHISQPCPGGEENVRAIQMALAVAGVQPDQVDYVNGHGTSTQLGDKTETMVIKKVFGEHAYRMPVSSIKGAVGHMQGACGAAEVAACCMAFRDNMLPPTLNLEFPDPACDLDFVANKPRHTQVNLILKNSFGFGGRNTALVLRRYSERPTAHSRSTLTSFHHENRPVANRFP
ncbi:MAG: beta-ketoacyl-[acyl-carrier-protein] synthase family protein [Verrucomicrobia bacterium]|nr:beta-ketoacyl-[acyl-carrier-protein] synthase family protein [Verrucomicrobiota bacterium]